MFLHSNTRKRSTSHKHQSPEWSTTKQTVSKITGCTITTQYARKKDAIELARTRQHHDPGPNSHEEDQ
jgi:hypothetical protein